MKKSILTITAAILTVIPAVGQTQQSLEPGWTLRQCIDYARENNIQVKQAQINKENSDEDVLQAKAQIYPTLSASTGQSVSFSKVEDMNGDKNLDGTYTGTYGLNASWTLYNGGRIYNSYKLQQIYNDAYVYDVLDAQNDIEVAVTQAYLNILYAKEAVATDENTVEASKAQLDRAKEMYADGAISLSDYVQFESQYSSDDYQLVSARNNLSSYVLKLKQLLELDIDQDFSVYFPVLGDEDVLRAVPEVRMVYEKACEVMPDMQASRLDIKAAQVNEKIAKASFIPSLTASASLGTANASGVGSNFFNQLGDRVNGSAGLTLSIPIFTGRSAKTSYAKAKNSTRNAELTYQSAQKNMLSTIESLYQDATGAQSRYLAAQKKVESASTSYDLQCEKFNEGMINAVDLMTAKNTYTAAQQELNQSKYQAILSVELLNFYMDQPIEL